MCITVMAIPSVVNMVTIVVAQYGVAVVSTGVAMTTSLDLSVSLMTTLECLFDLQPTVCRAKSS